LNLPTCEHDQPFSQNTKVFKRRTFISGPEVERRQRHRNSWPEVEDEDSEDEEPVEEPPHAQNSQGQQTHLQVIFNSHTEVFILILWRSYLPIHKVYPFFFHVISF